MFRFWAVAAVSRACSGARGAALAPWGRCPQLGLRWRKIHFPWVQFHLEPPTFHGFRPPKPQNGSRRCPKRAVAPFARENIGGVGGGVPLSGHHLSNEAGPYRSSEPPLVSPVRGRGPALAGEPQSCRQKKKGPTKKKKHLQVQSFMVWKELSPWKRLRS